MPASPAPTAMAPWAHGGCTYCNNEAFIPAYCTPDISVTEQIEQGIAFHRRRYRRAENYLAYFQAYTNTYAAYGAAEGLI
ncbi:MAG: hypothetical protein MZV63_23500 [Marinilabiliales bacterium]|nr:hypothetical protein [Marinilabiliales bacterium]